MAYGWARDPKGSSGLCAAAKTSLYQQSQGLPPQRGDTFLPGFERDSLVFDHGRIVPFTGWQVRSDYGQERPAHEVDRASWRTARAISGSAPIRASFASV